jgi:GNAT superfamily N-acetyltransferase
MGAGVVVSCHPDRVDWLRATLGPLARDAIFSAETIACLSHYVEPDELVMSGPDLKFVCTSADLRPQEAALSAEGSLVEGDSVVRLYRHPGFRHALHYRVDPKRPDVLAAVATRNGEIVGIAGASADCDAMWQIGVDVVAPARGQRLGRALVSCLAAAILARGRLPYYSTTVANLASRNLAIGVGFWPAWIEMWTYAR